MKKILKKIVKKLIYKEKCDSETYIQYLKKNGAKIGERTILYEPISNCIDSTRPYLIEIGDDVQITRGVTILTHDYGWSVIKKITGEILGSSGKVVIENNVFIGVNTVITKNTHIGSNVIIGANSLVRGNIESNSVYAGSPAKKIMSIEEYYYRRRKAQLREALELFESYYNSFRRIPNKEIFSEFFFLFEDRSINIEKYFLNKMQLVGNFDKTVDIYRSNKDLQLFSSYEEFIDYCMKECEIKNKT